MQCPEQYEWELFVDKEMSPLRQGELKSHLEGCPACGTLLATLRQEDELIAVALAATPFPPDLTAVIKSRLVKAGDHGRRWLRLFLPALALTGMLVALGIGWWPLFEKLQAVLNLLGFGDPLLQLIFLAAGVMRGLAEAVIRGKSVMPALTVFVLCVLYVQLKIKLGGRAHV